MLTDSWIWSPMCSQSWEKMKRTTGSEFKNQSGIVCSESTYRKKLGTWPPQTQGNEHTSVINRSNLLYRFSCICQFDQIHHHYLSQAFQSSFIIHRGERNLCLQVNKLVSSFRMKGETGNEHLEGVRLHQKIMSIFRKKKVYIEELCSGVPWYFREINQVLKIFCS